MKRMLKMSRVCTLAEMLSKIFGKKTRGIGTLFMIMVHCSTSYRASSHVADLNTRNKLLTLKLLKQGYIYRYHKLCITFFLDFTTDTMI